MTNNKLINEQGQLTTEGKNVFNTFRIEVKFLLSHCESWADVCTMGSVLANELGKIVLERKLKYSK